MTIQELGSLGELIAAIATVVTLAYLAVQIRQNTRLMAFTLAQTNRDIRGEPTRILASDPDAARVFRTGLVDPSGLGDRERYQFDALMTLVVNGYEQAHSQGTLAEMTEQSAWILSQPGVRVWWAEFGRSTYSESFCSSFEAALERRAPAGGLDGV